MAGKKGHRGWGWLRKSGRGPVKRWQASYLHQGIRYNAPNTFAHRVDAEGWLSAERRLIDLNVWTSPAARNAEEQASGITLVEYTPRWIEQRIVAGRPLRPRTKSHYMTLFEERIKPTSLGNIPMHSITTEAVRAWYATTLIDKPTYRSHAYQLLHAVLSTAVADGHLSSNPAQIRGAGSATTKKEAVILEVDEVTKLADTIDGRYKALILISSWCGLRWGEVTALERQDCSADCSVITVRRGVVHRDGKCIDDTTKTSKRRTVAVPPHIQPDIQRHLATYVAKGGDSLLFPADRSCHLSDKTFRRYYEKALAAIGRDGKKKPRPSIHDMRHFCGTTTARVGNLVETMGRLGHTTIKASLNYQSIVSGRDAEIATALSELAKAKISE